MNDQEAAVVLRRIGDAYNGLLWDDDEKAAIGRAIELLDPPYSIRPPMKKAARR